MTWEELEGRNACEIEGKDAIVVKDDVDWEEGNCSSCIRGMSWGLCLCGSWQTHLIFILYFDWEMLKNSLYIWAESTIYTCKEAYLLKY